MAITLQLSAGPYTSGVSPFLVYCDASETSDTRVTHASVDLDYYWEVENSSNTKITSGNGCCWATVLEDPDIYTINLSATEPSSLDVTTTSFSVTALDPDTEFSTTDTICLSIAGDFTGAPTGASTVTITDGDDINTYLAANKRVLLKRGEVYPLISGGVGLSLNEYLGAFGSVGNADSRGIYDNDPILTTSGSAISCSVGPCRIEHINVSSTLSDASGTSSRGIQIGGNGDASYVVWNKCKVKGFEQCLVASTSLADFYSVDPAEYVTANKCHVIPADTGSQYGAYLGGNKNSILGSYFEGGVTREHTVRIPYSHKFVLADSQLGTTLVDTKHTLKVHHWTPSQAASNGGKWEGVAKNLCIINNDITGIGMDWGIGFGPSNSSSDHRLSGVFFSRNKLTMSGIQIASVFWTQCPRIENNIFILSSAASIEAVTVTRRGVEPDATYARIYNNTLWALETGATKAQLFNVQEGGYSGTPALIYNNVAAGEVGDGTAYVGAGNAEALVGNNLDSDDSPTFTDPFALDFSLLSSSPQVEAASGGLVVRDYNNSIRDNSSPDVGAFEFISTSSNPTIISATADITLPGFTVEAAGSIAELPEAPSSISVYESGGDIYVQWSAAENATTYTVSQDLSGGTNYVELSGAISGLSATSVGSAGVGTKRFSVYGTNANGDGPPAYGFIYTAPSAPAISSGGGGFKQKGSRTLIKLDI